MLAVRIGHKESIQPLQAAWIIVLHGITPCRHTCWWFNHLFLGVSAVINIINILSALILFDQSIVIAYVACTVVWILDLVCIPYLISWLINWLCWQILKEYITAPLAFEVAISSMICNRMIFNLNGVINSDFDMSVELRDVALDVGA